VFLHLFYPYTGFHLFLLMDSLEHEPNRFQYTPAILPNRLIGTFCKKPYLPYQVCPAELQQACSLKVR
jgi:hypothetical protein